MFERFATSGIDMERLVGARIYMDTNTFIAFAEGVESARAPVSDLFSGADSKKWQLVTSELTLAEVLIRPLRLGQQELIALYEQLLAPREGLLRQPVSLEILRTSAQPGGALGMKLADAIHAATAHEFSCQFLITEDKRVRSFEQVVVLRLADLVLTPPPPAPETP